MDNKTAQPKAQLIEAGPRIERLLRLRVQLLEAELARLKLYTDFSERIDVDHYQWMQQQHEMRYLKTTLCMLSWLVIASVALSIFLVINR